jgi:hypothetical protein
MSYYKSLLTGGKAISKMLIDPVATNSRQDMQLSGLMVETLTKIENNYVVKMANREYTSIPNDMFGYLTLSDTMLTSIAGQKNSNLKLLLQIALDGLTGALNSKSLSAENAELEINVAMLQKKVDEILSSKNEIKAMHGDVCGEFVIAKTFKLAPLYSYYIHLYGMPAFGVGFDPKKLKLVQAILAKHGIA